MTEEEKVSKKEEAALGVLQQARNEKADLEKLNERLEKNIAELKELKAEDILSGKAILPKPSEVKVVGDVEYSKAALSGKILK